MSEAQYIDFGSGGIVPVVVQNELSGEVLVVAYANQEALERTLESGVVTFWSRSRQEQWVKGETSGNRYFVGSVRVNCEGNSLLYLARPENGGMCHVEDAQGNAYSSCFYRTVTRNESGLELKLNE
jgi:phosphoribosyl-AMP cyclohydrolase